MIFFEVREITRVGDKGDEVDNKRQEQLLKNRRIVAHPHEVYKDSDLIGRENLVIVCIGQNFDKARCVISNKNPVEIKDFGFNLLEV